ncbi:MAG TPA: hypothetical protein VJC18_11065, partial [bacterium]|nr:hypothetical protein [bacterium]
MAITLAQGKVGPVTDWLSSFVGAAATANAGGVPVINVAPAKIGEQVIVPPHPDQANAWQLRTKKQWLPQHINLLWTPEQLHVARMSKGDATLLPVLKTTKTGRTVWRRGRLGVWPVDANSCFVLSPPERGISGVLKINR